MIAADRDFAVFFGVDLFSAAVDGQALTAPAGIAPFKHFAAQTQITLAFTATGDNVVNLSAGSVTVELYVFRRA